MTPVARTVHWGKLGVAGGLFGLLVAGIELPAPVAATIGVLAAWVFLSALDIPQRALQKAGDLHGGHVARAIYGFQVRRAVRLCAEAADAIRSLLAAEEGGRFLKGVRVRWRQGRQAVALYERLHRTTVVHAVETSIAVGAADDGALALAHRPRSVSDLTTLQAELLRIVVELGFPES